MEALRPLLGSHWARVVTGGAARVGTRCIGTSGSVRCDHITAERVVQCHEEAARGGGGRCGQGEHAGASLRCAQIVRSRCALRARCVPVAAGSRCWGWGRGRWRENRRERRRQRQRPGGRRVHGRVPPQASRADEGVAAQVRGGQQRALVKRRGACRAAVLFLTCAGGGVHAGPRMARYKTVNRCSSWMSQRTRTLRSLSWRCSMSRCVPTQPPTRLLRLAPR